MRLADRAAVFGDIPSPDADHTDRPAIEVENGRTGHSAPDGLGRVLDPSPAAPGIFNGAVDQPTSSDTSRAGLLPIARSTGRFDGQSAGGLISGGAATIQAVRSSSSTKAS